MYILREIRKVTAVGRLWEIREVKSREGIGDKGVESCGKAKEIRDVTAVGRLGEIREVKAM